MNRAQPAEKPDFLSRGASVPDTTSPASSILQLRGVGKAYKTKGGPIRAIGEIDLDIADGQFVSIVGPSGCGKSTILSMLAGLTSPTEGEIVFRGKRISGPSELMGLVPQRDSLFPWRTIHANIELGLELQRVPAKQRRQRAAVLLERLGLAGFGDRYPHELSGGMRQRVNIARALVRQPQVLLMDEPFGPLDALTRGNLQSLLMDLWREENKTIIFVTHDLVEAISLSDRVVVMTGRPGHIKDIVDIDIPRPRDVFHVHKTAGFEVYHDRMWRHFIDAVHSPGTAVEQA